jgi:hypothetical protein
VFVFPSSRYGTGYVWQVVVGGLVSAPSPFTTSYTSPSLSSLGPPIVSLATGGGTVVTLIGADFGAVGTPGVTGNYSGGSTGLNFQAACTISVAHTQMQCTTVAGVGSGCVDSLVVPVLLLSVRFPVCGFAFVVAVVLVCVCVCACVCASVGWRGERGFMRGFGSASTFFLHDL